MSLPGPTRHWPPRRVCVCVVCVSSPARATTGVLSVHVCPHPCARARQAGLPTTDGAADEIDAGDGEGEEEVDDGFAMPDDAPPAAAAPASDDKDKGAPVGGCHPSPRTGRVQSPRLLPACSPLVCCLRA